MLQYVESRLCFNLFLNWFSDVEFCMCSSMDFQKKGPVYLIVNCRVIFEIVLRCYLEVLDENACT